VAVVQVEVVRVGIEHPMEPLVAVHLLKHQ